MTPEERSLIRQIDTKLDRLKEMKKELSDVLERIEHQTTRQETLEASISDFEAEIDTLLTTLKGL